MGNEDMYKNTVTINCILLLFLITLVTRVSAGGPWIHPKGKGYIQLSYSIIPTYNTLYGKNNHTIQLDRDVSDQTVVAYFEYGFGHGLMGIFEIPVKIISVEQKNNQSNNLTGLGNISMAVKHNFIDKTILFSGQLKIEVKESNKSTDIVQSLRTGVNAWGVVPSIHIGGSLTNFYTYFDIGFRFRTNNYSNEWIFIGEAGYFFLKRFWVVGALDVRETITNGTHDAIPTSTGLYPDNQEYFAYGFKLIAEISKRIGLNFSSFGALSGNLVAKSPAITIGTYYRW